MSTLGTSSLETNSSLDSTQYKDGHPQSSLEDKFTHHTSQSAALLSVTEIGLGSVLHGLRLPLSGHFLSLNQGYLLLRGVKPLADYPKSYQLPLIASGVAAVLKSLSPAGKKLTPMLAISAQGALMSFGLFCFGTGLLGFMVSMTLLSIWAFAQPLLLYYFLYGQTLWDVAGYYLAKLQELTSVKMEDLFWVLAALILIKCILGSLIVYLGFSKQFINKKIKTLQDSFHQRGVELISTHSKLSVTESKRSAFLLAFKDLMRPVFLISLVLTFLFFFFAEATSSQLIWSLLRPLALGFILFYLVRVLPIDRWVSEIRVARPESVFVQALDQAIQSLKSKRESSQTKENSV